MIFISVRTDVENMLDKETDPASAFMTAEKLANAMNERRRQIKKVDVATIGPSPFSVSDIKSFSSARFLAARASKYSSSITLFGGFSSSWLIFRSCSNFIKYK